MSGIYHPAKYAITTGSVMLSPIVSFMGITFNIYALILILLLVIFVFAYRRAAAKHNLDWVDMITHEGNKVSFSKILQMLGGVVGTWIVVQMTLSGGLTWDLFAIYLAYVASVDGFSKFITARYSNGNDTSSYSQRGNYSTRRRGADASDAIKDVDDIVDDRPAAGAKTPGADD
jgi:hypothetical protein